MVHDQPEGGSGNYDKFNRNKWNGRSEIPPPFYPKVDETDVIQKMIEDEGIKTLGTFSKDDFLFPSDKRSKVSTNLITFASTCLHTLAPIKMQCIKSKPIFFMREYLLL